jgi:predicted dienelactone hydrolase
VKIEVIVAMLALTVLVVGSACQSGGPQRAVSVGFTTREWSDPTRRNWDNDGDWPLSAAFWYPAAAGTIEREFVSGMPFLPFLRHGWVAENAPVQPNLSRLPLILLSHGTGGSLSGLSWLAESLVEQGYLVAAVTHHGNSIGNRDLSAQGFFLFWERARELRLLLDRVLEDPTFGPHIDIDRIGAAGFSLGGNSVVLLAGGRLDMQRYIELCNSSDAPFESCDPPPESPFSRDDLLQLIETDPATRASLARANDSYRDPRVRAVYAIAPAVLVAVSDRGAAEVSVPLRVAVGDLDTMAPLESNAKHVVRQASGAELLVLPGVDHYSFLGPCGWAGRLALGELCIESPEAPRLATLRLVADDANAFFARTLR